MPRISSSGPPSLRTSCSVASITTSTPVSYTHLMPEFREYRRSLDLSALNTRSVDAAKVTDHHALIITGIVPEMCIRDRDKTKIQSGGGILPTPDVLMDYAVNINRT